MSKIALKCDQCGAERLVFPSEIKGKNARYRNEGKDYRCRACWDATRKGKAVNPRVQQKVSITCISCGKATEYSPSAAKAKKTSYCRSCRTKHIPNNKQTPGDAKILVSCPDCGKSRTYKRTAKISGRCASCARKGHLSGAWSGGKVKLHCTVCRKAKEVAASRIADYTRKSGEYFCAACAMANREGVQNPNWKGGLSFEPYPVAWNENLKNQIRTRDAHTCRVCGAIHQAGKRRFSVHHIDYNKENLSLSNLVTLCPSCHGKTNGNRAYWTGHFLTAQEGQM